MTEHFPQQNREKTSGISYRDAIITAMPRLLSQMDRNPHSPTYGSCCRNHWHYRIEDISNSQFQQLSLTFACIWKAPQLENNPYAGSPELLEWITAALRYTIGLQRFSGAFDEVYQGQDSYAATGFVAFALSETVQQIGEHLDSGLRAEITQVTERAADFLYATPEIIAANQLAIAAAVQMNAGALGGKARFEHQRQALVQRLKEFQDDEGWFVDYGGPDIGYGSLTLAYLALQATRLKDETVMEMARKLAAFLKPFVSESHVFAGILGSRNTTYFIPLGATLMAPHSNDAAQICKKLSKLGFDYFLNGLDDRYLAYLSPYFMLAELPGCETDSHCPTESAYFPNAGLWVVRNENLSFAAALNKGGVFELHINSERWLDSGIFVTLQDGTIATSQHGVTKGERSDDGSAHSAGTLNTLTPITITPLSNILFRAFNMFMPAFFRGRILSLLRRKAMPKGRPAGHFRREIVLDDDAVSVVDDIFLQAPPRLIDIQTGCERAFSFASTGFFDSNELRTGWPDRLRIEGNGTRSVRVRRRFTEKAIHTTIEYGISPGG